MGVQMKVWIAQCLCPDRHCILAAAGEATNYIDAENKTAVPLREAVLSLLAAQEINPWCGICRAPKEQWRIELAETRFASLEEGKAEIEQLAALQIVNGIVWGELLGPRKLDS